MSSWAEQFDYVWRKYADVVVGHDHVHPDRGICGGVGRCALCLTEVDTERDVVEMLKEAARGGQKRTTTLKPGGS